MRDPYFFPARAAIFAVLDLLPKESREKTMLLMFVAVELFVKLGVAKQDLGEMVASAHDMMSRVTPDQGGST